MGILDWLFGPDKPTEYTAPPLAQYPTEEDAAFARKNGAFYGTASEPFAEGLSAVMLNGSANGAKTSQVTDPRYARATDSPLGENAAVLPDVYGRAALAANRSAIAGLGLDPRRFSMEPNMDAERATIGGAYSRENDHGFVIPGASADSASTLVHEALHRGLQKMRTAGTMPQFSSTRPTAMDDGALEEAIVRIIMERSMGDPEQGSLAIRKKKNADAQFALKGVTPGYGHKFIDDIEAAAAQQIARQRPGGPR